MISYTRIGSVTGEFGIPTNNVRSVAYCLVIVVGLQLGSDNFKFSINLVHKFIQSSFHVFLANQNRC